MSWWIDLIYEEILLYHSPEAVRKYEIKKAKGESLIKDVLSRSESLEVVSAYLFPRIRLQYYVLKSDEEDEADFN